jgi:hypothetical protein
MNIIIGHTIWTWTASVPWCSRAAQSRIRRRPKPAHTSRGENLYNNLQPRRRFQTDRGAEGRAIENVMVVDTRSIGRIKGIRAAY